MNDPTHPGPARAGPVEPAAPVKTVKPARPRKWRRRLLWCAAALLIVAVVFRLSLPFLLPWTLARIAAGYDLACSYDRLELSLLGGDAELWHLTVGPSEGGEPYFQLEYCRADLATPHLLLGRLIVRRLEADGVDVLVERDADGNLDILKRLEKAAARKPAASPAALESASPPPDGAPPAIDFTSPLRIDAMRLQHMHARVRDRSVTPVFETRFNTNFRFSNLAAGDRPLRFELQASAPPVLDAFTIEGTGTIRRADIDAECIVTMTGLHLRPLAPYLRPLGLRPVARGLSFRARARIETRGIPPSVGNDDGRPPDAVRATIALADIAATADGAEAVALDSLTVEARRVGWREAHLGEIVATGARAGAVKTGAGVVRVVGIEVAPVSDNEAAPAPPQPRPPAAAPASPPIAAEPAPASPAGAPFRSRLDLLALRHAKVSWRDESMRPPVDLALEVTELAARNIVVDPAQPGAVIELAGTLGAPGLVHEIRLAGTAAPFAPVKALELKADLAGVAPGAVAPYLAPLGIESLLKSGTLATSLKATIAPADGGGMRVDAAVGRTVFADGETLVDFGGARLEEIVVDPEAAEVRVGAVDLQGPKVAVRRLESGAIEALGLRFTPPQTAAATDPAAFRPAAPPDAEGAVLPAVAHEAGAVQTAAAPAAKAYKVRLGRLAWKGLGVEIGDAAVTPGARLAFEDLGVEVRDLVVDLGEAPAGTPGKLSISLGAPGLAESVEVTGTVLPQPAHGSLDLKVAAGGITAAAAVPYLRAAGIEPALREGALSLTLAAEYAVQAGGLTASAAVTGVSFRDGDEEIAGLDSARVEGVAVTSAGVRVATIAVDRPRMEARREASGAVLAGGLKLDPAAAPGAAGDSPAPAPSPAPDATARAPLGFELGSLRVNAAECRWADAGASPAVATAVRSSIALDGLVVGRAAEPARVHIDVSAAGVLEEMRIAGHVSIAPAGVSARLEVDGRGLQAGPLAAYLPQGVGCDLRDGRLKTTFEVGIADLAEGGRAARVEVRDVDFRSGPGPEALFKLASARFAAPRIALAAGRVDIDEIAVAGLEVEVARSASGALQAFGISVEAPGQKAADPPAAEPATAPTSPAAAEVAPEAAPAATAAPAAVARPQRLPLVTVQKLALSLDRLRFLDLSSPGAKALTASFSLVNPAPLAILGDEVESNEPLKLELSGKIDPLVSSILVSITASPFTRDPELAVKLDASGIQGADLASIAPALRDKLDGHALDDGRLVASVEATLKLNRRGPMDFDLARGFGAELVVENAHFTSRKDGPVVAGLDGLRIDLARMDPGTGGVRVKEIEVSRPILHIQRTAAGIQALGILVKVPPAAPGEGETAPETEPAASPAPEASAPQAPPSAPAAGPGPEIRIDRILASGLDVRFTDETVTPAASVWLNGLEVDVRNATNRILTEAQTTRFQIALQAGKTPMPRPFKGSALLGAMSDAAALATGQEVDTGVALEDRAAFDDVIIRGKLGLYPQPTGFLETRVNALDLLSVKGLAAQSGVNIQGGVFDHRSMIRLPGDGSAHLDMPVARLTDLDVTEPPDGPIFRYLHLPAPLNAVLFALRDADGAVNVSLDVAKQPGGFGRADLLAFAGELSWAVSKICATAVASAPMRVVGGVTDLIPLGGGGPAAPEAPITLDFATGDAHLVAAEASKLAPLIERLRDGEPLTVTIGHSFGAGDIDRARIRANPSPEECLELGARLRREGSELRRERDELAAATRAAVASALLQEAPQYTERLRDLERKIAASDRALDAVYALTLPGAERGAPRRTRNAALAVAQARVDAVKAVFAAGGIADLAESVKAPRPTFPETTAAASGTVTIDIAPRQGR